MHSTTCTHAVVAPYSSMPYEPVYALFIYQSRLPLVCTSHHNAWSAFPDIDKRHLRPKVGVLPHRQAMIASLIGGQRYTGGIAPSKYLDPDIQVRESSASSRQSAKHLVELKKINTH